MASPQNFTDWSQVEGIYGNAVSQALQQNNIPLSQVGSVIGSLSQFGGMPSGAGGGPNFTDQFGQMAQLINLAAKGGFGQGGQGGNQGPSFNPAQNPNYPTSLLGAQALRAVGLNPTNTATINPTPANTPSSGQFAQSGVSSVASPQTVSLSGTTPPQTTVPSIFTPGTPNQPTVSGPAPITPAQQPTGANVPRRGDYGVYGSPPPIQPAAPGQVPPAAPTPPFGGFGPNPTRPGLMGYLAASNPPLGASQAATTEPSGVGSMPPPAPTAMGIPLKT